MNPVVVVALVYVGLIVLFVGLVCWVKTTERKFFVDRPSGHPPTGRHLRSLPSPQGLSEPTATSDAWLVAEGLRGGDDANAPMAVEPLPAAPDTTSPVSGAQPQDGAASSCGEVTVYVAGMSLRCRCERGEIVDTFAAGFPCPHHKESA